MPELGCTSHLSLPAAAMVWPMKHCVTLVESDEGWAVWCDDLTGCCSQGATREEALGNIRVAIAEYLAAQAEELASA